MTAPSMETVLERVRKMHAKAESAREIGSMAEAETFAAAVARMLEAHKLSMSDVELETQDADDPMGEQFVDFEGWGLQPKARREVWALSLATAVARAHYCRAVDFTASHRKQTVQFIGRTSDRMIAEHVFLTLYRSALHLSRQAYAGHKRDLGDRSDVTYLNAWRVGFVSEIASRYRQQASANAGMMALVRASGEAEAYMRQLHRGGLRSSQSRMAGRNATGAQAGREAGRAANLSPAKGVTGPLGRATRQLGSGS